MMGNIENSWQQDRTKREKLSDRTVGLLGSVLGSESLISDGISDSHLLQVVRCAAAAMGVPPEEVLEKTAIHSCKPRSVMEHMRMIATISNLPIRKIKIQGNWYKNNAAAVVSFINNEGVWEPVALTSDQKGYYYLYNPKTNVKEKLHEGNAKYLSEYGWMIYRGLPEKSVGLLDFIRFCSSFVRGSDAFAIIFALFVGSIVSLALPKAMGMVFDQLIPQGDFMQLMIIGLVLFSLALCQCIVQILQGVAMINVEGLCDVFGHGALSSRMLSMKVKFFASFTVGDLADRMDSFESMRSTIMQVMSGGLASALFALPSVVMLFYYNIHLALVVLAAVVVYFLISSFFLCMDIVLSRRLLVENGKISGWILQMVNGVTTIRNFGAEEFVLWKWASHFVKQRSISIKKRKWTIASNVFTSSWQTLVTVVVYYMLAGSVQTRSSVGDFIAFNTAFMSFFAGVLAVQGAAVKLSAILPLYERMKPVLDNVPEIASTGKRVELTGEIMLEGISFAYNVDNNKVLNNISIKINAGEFIALVGPSGSGKSTVMKLLLGFEEAQEGVILYDKLDLKELDVRFLRRQCGVVLQNGELVTGDILHNIVGMNDLLEEDAWRAAEMAGIGEDIRRMPMAMRTLVSEGGSNLSGGQRQRILIARALVSNPKIIFFDEATSALDSISQKVVMESLQSLRMTRVVIAHRLSTIRDADKIYVIKDGMVAECGKYEELMAKKGCFFAMAERQIIE